jgi:hypothetical protein
VNRPRGTDRTNYVRGLQNVLRHVSLRPFRSRLMADDFPKRLKML